MNKVVLKDLKYNVDSHGWIALDLSSIYHG